MMGRTGLIVALSLLAATAVTFALWPDLDLKIAAAFYRPGTGFVLDRSLTVNGVRDAATVLIGLLVAPAIWAVLVKLISPARRMTIPARTALFLAGTLLLAPLLTANLALKEHWGRPRPNALITFGGDIQTFRPWWDPRGTCTTNCSFIGGETAAAFWTIAPAALAPPQWRPLAYGAALAFGGGVSFLRIAGGGHFFSDTAFAALITFLIVWVMYGLLYRREVSDTAVEHRLERIAWALRRPFGGRSPPRPVSDDERRA